jgi:LEA14-like dessication related protein
MSAKRAMVGVVCLLLLLPGCVSSLTQLLGAIERPTVKAIRPRITGIGLQKINMAFDVDVENPYPIPLKSPRFKYGVDIQGAEFFNSEQAATVDVPAKGVGTVTLPISLEYTKLWTTYKKLADAKEVDYTLRGALMLAAAGQSYELPMSHSGKFPVLRPPKFANLSVKFSDVSMTGAKVSVEGDIQNPNIFSLGVQDLGYALKLGEVSVGDVTASTSRSIPAAESGKLKLTGQISAASALLKILGGQGLGTPRIAPTGTIETPYGTAKLQE